MKMKLKLEDIETGETEDVIAGLVIARRWENEHGQPVDDALESDRLGVLVDFARLAYVRKHGQPITSDEFEARFEVDVLSGSTGAPASPSDPATAP